MPDTAGCVPCAECGGDQRLGWHLHTPEPVTARLIPAPDQATVHHTLVLDLLQEHRRVQNVRSCTGHGCAWHPTPVGRTGDPDAMRRRHAQFNAHLADLIVASLSGASTPVPSQDGHRPAALTGTPAPEAAPPPGQRPAAH